MCGCGQVTPIAKIGRSDRGDVTGKHVRFIPGHRAPLDPLERERLFWQKVDRRGPDECWEWTGSRHGKGYGMVGVGSRIVDKAHRVSWRMHNGLIPEGMHVLHHCDNPPCVNPAHLFIGTNDDNVRDKIAKGRQRVPCGEAHGNAKLTERDVIEIRLLSDVPVKEIAARFSISGCTVRRVRNRTAWAHVKEVQV